MQCGVLCLVPGQIVLLKLYLQDHQRTSATQHVKRAFARLLLAATALCLIAVLAGNALLHAPHVVTCDSSWRRDREVCVLVRSDEHESKGFGESGVWRKWYDLYIYYVSGRLQYCVLRSVVLCLAYSVPYALPSSIPALSCDT